MTSSYLVCELCGNYGPPAGFFFKDGVRLCYACYFEGMNGEHEPEDRNAKPRKNHNGAAEQTDRRK